MQTSLFFLLVDSIWYRMKALRNGDRYFLRTMIYDARVNTFQYLMLFTVGYSIMTGFVILTSYFEQSDTSGFSAFKVFIYLIELSKVLLDQCILIAFFKLMSLQVKAFDDL